MIASLATKDIEAIRNISHKMLPSYNHFKVHEIIADLKYLEALESADNNSLDEIAAKINNISLNLFQQLESRLKSMQELVT